MSVQNFKPILWEGALIANFHNRSVAAGGLLSATPVETTAERVRFTAIGAGKVKDYEKGTISWEEMETSNVDLLFDKQKYFAFKVHDVDKVQMKRDLLMETTAEHAAVMAELYDQNFYSVLAAGADDANVIGSADTPTELHAKNAYDIIVDLGTKLSQAKAPKIDRFVSVNSEILGLLSKDPRYTKDPKVLENGLVEGSKINGFTVVVSEELPAGQIVAHWKKAIGAGTQLDKVEALRLQDDFADGVRGIQQYGAIVLKAEGVAVCNYSVVAAPLTP